VPTRYAATFAAGTLFPNDGWMVIFGALMANEAFNHGLKALAKRVLGKEFCARPTGATDCGKPAAVASVRGKRAAL
jgi:hypothetical protein